jgi:hypothetical protein
MHILQIQSQNWSIVQGLEDRAAWSHVSKHRRHIVMLRTSIQGLGHKVTIFQCVTHVASLRRHLWNILWPISKEPAPRNRVAPIYRFPWDILGCNNFVHDPLELLEDYSQGSIPGYITMWAKMGPKAPPSPTKLPWAAPEAFHRYSKGLLTAQIMIPQLYITI